MKVNRKYIWGLLGVISLIFALVIHNTYFKPWTLEGDWVSGPNDGFGLMPVKKEFKVNFSKNKLKFKDNVRLIKSYKYDLENQLVILHLDNRTLKIGIIDKNTIRFNEGSRNVGLRVYHRKK